MNWIRQDAEMALVIVLGILHICIKSKVKVWLNHLLEVAMVLGNYWQSIKRKLLRRKTSRESIKRKSTPTCISQFVLWRRMYTSSIDLTISVIWILGLPLTLWNLHLKQRKKRRNNLAERKQSESHVLLIPGFKCYRHWDFRGLCGIFTPNREVKMTKASWKKGRSQESMSSRSSCSSQS